MGWPTLSAIFDIGVDILKTTRSTLKNTILAQTGDVAAEKVFGDDAEWWQHVGFASRPSVPTKGSAAAQAIAIKGSDRDRVIASRDVRGQAIYGQLDDGETCVYATGPDGTATGRLLLKKDGSVNAYTQTSDGKSVLVSVTPTGINLATPWGMFVMDQNGIRLGVDGAGLQITKDGVTVIGKNVAIDGASVAVGANASQPALWGPTGMSGVASASVKIAL